MFLRSKLRVHERGGYLFPSSNIFFPEKQVFKLNIGFSGPPHAMRQFSSKDILRAPTGGNLVALDS